MYFTKYDIRGLFGTRINERFASDLGGFIAENLSDKKPVVVGFDSRSSSPVLVKPLLESINLAGIDVINISICTTPIIHFAQKFLNSSVAVMVTASHNPIEYNGFKIIKDGRVFCCEGIESRFARLERKNGKRGKIFNINVIGYYTTHLFSFLKFKKRLKIAWDCGNSPLSIILPDFCKAMDFHDHIILNKSLDGNKVSDPSKIHNLTQLMKCVTEERCDVGFAFNTDGDRLGVVNSKGELVIIDHVILLLLREFKQKGEYLLDIKLSYLLKRYVRDVIGGNPIDHCAGRSSIINRMLSNNSVFAGECTGHLFFSDNNYDDGLFAALKLANLISLGKVDFRVLPDCFISQEIRIKSDNPSLFIVKLKKFLCEAEIDFDDLDGLKVHYDFGWWLIRASNTEQAVVARYESYEEGNFLKMKEVTNFFLYL